LVTWVLAAAGGAIPTNGNCRVLDNVAILILLTGGEFQSSSSTRSISCCLG
jgi:hypothetical protein